MSKRSRYYLRKYSTRIYRRRKSLKEFESVAVNICAAILVIILLVIAWRLLTGKKSDLSVSQDTVSAFRIPYKTLNELNELSKKYGISFPELLTYYSLDNNFFQTRKVTPDITEIEQTYIMNYHDMKSKYKKDDVEPYLTIFQSIFDEIAYFPIASGYNSDSGSSYMFGDSWGAGRTYSGERTHQGTDIIDRENVRGRIKVVSMTDGVIKDIGWSELGGYNIGIKGVSGNYYYYAHFDSFADNLTEGLRVQAGQLLGYMGDTGYSKKEGTTGNFQVHLHVGIAPETSLAKDFWINPYPFLQFVESSTSELQ